MDRPRKPTAVKIMEGNRGKQPLPHNEPKPAPLGATPEPPKHLTKIAREEWKRIAGDLAKLGLASALDVAALTFYCEIYASWREAILIIAREGPFYEVRGIKCMHPAQAQKEKCEALMRPYRTGGEPPSLRIKLL
jgi:P27 family predicted phage terminase small subunit